jgi:nucleoside-diphosphate-sugar epimerase
MLSLLGAFDGQVRELKEMLYEFEDDFAVDSSRFETAFRVPATPLEQALAATVDWYRARA